MLEKNDIAKFWNEGALLARDVLSEGETILLRHKIEGFIATWESQGLAQRTLTGGRLAVDLLSVPVLRNLLLDSRIISVVRSILGTQPVYFGDSTLSYGSASRGWHRDNRVCDRDNFSGLDWKGNYPIIRLGFYLQDHKIHSGGLGVRLGSHLPPDNNPFVHSKILPHYLRSILANHTGKPVNMGSTSGDLVIWSLKTLHSADAVRLKWLPHFRVPPFLENITPNRAKIPHSVRRIACFMTFAASGEHLDRYLSYLHTRDYMLELWKKSVWDEESISMAKEAGLSLVNQKNIALRSSSNSMPVVPRRIEESV